MSGDARWWFSPDERGFVRHWLCAGPRVTCYEGQANTETEVRQEVIDRTVVDPPAAGALGEAGPWGVPWAFYQPGRNVFLERSGFYHELSHLDLYAVTDLETDADRRLPVRIWTANTTDLWCNGRHLLRYTGTLHRRPDVTGGFLLLRPGRNRIVARVQELAARECPFLVGLQLLAAAEDVRVVLPGEADTTRRLREVDDWLTGLRASSRCGIAAEAPPPVPATVSLSGRVGSRSGGRPEDDLPWPAGEAACSWDAADVVSATVSAEAAGQRLERVLEFPAARKIHVPSGGDIDAHRRAYLEEVAAAAPGGHRGGVMGVLARRVLGRPDDAADAACIADALDWIDGRPDCADFPLSAILRLYATGWGTEPQRERIRRTVLGFRYWTDEPGSDAMCFGSENHALLFHGCQHLAGLLLPEATFANSGRTGREQAALGRQRCEAWLAERERFGYWEFLSSTYFPLTTAALMNLVDFAADAELSRRAAVLADGIFEMLAEHSFDGVTVGPQGRVYRGILYPHTSGSQGMLSYATDRAAWATSPWMAYVASSPRYKPPAGLAERMAAPAARSYRQANVRICLHKTPHYMLSSLEIPCDFGDGVGGGPLRPGEMGYQQHLWHATLGRDCHVFVNHPGASFDFSQARPGFWYGNGYLPRLTQKDNAVAAIYAVPDTHPVQFTHAHWPADAFDRHERHDGWHFGAKGDGLIGLWCSRATRLETEVLTDRELRADGDCVAWLCVCSDRHTAGSFDAFVRDCAAQAPTFDPATPALIRGQIPFFLTETQALTGGQGRQPPR